MRESRNLFNAIVFLMVFALSTPIGVALAQPSQPIWGVFTNAGSVPGGSVLVLGVTYRVVNHPDIGPGGIWALDNYIINVQVWLAPDGTFYAITRYLGRWYTFEGAPSPENGVLQSKDASGRFEGGFICTFTADSYTSEFGYLGVKDFNGSKANIAGQDLDGFNLFAWQVEYFTSFFRLTSNYGWTYRYRGQTWNNYYSGNSGDIVV